MAHFLKKTEYPGTHPIKMYQAETKDQSLRHKKYDQATIELYEKEIISELD